MPRLARFEHNRWIGDKRDQVVHDTDNCAEDHLADLVAARTYLCFGPDTLAEARNRCYRPCRHCASARDAVDA